MRTLTCGVALAAVAALLLIAPPPRADAQLQYFNNFKERYPALEEQANEQKCNVCHGRLKTMRSEYAMALEEALGEKKVKDAEKIQAALEAVEAVEYEDGMTYKDLLDSGQLPAPFSE